VSTHCLNQSKEIDPLRSLKVTLPERGLEALFGPYDQNIKYLESLLSVRVGGRGGELLIEGEEQDVAVVERILKDFSQLFAEGKAPGDVELRAAFKQIAEDRSASLKDVFSSQKRINPSGRKQVTARSANQRLYLEAIEANDIVFGIGPAGTGKCIAADSLVLTERGMIEIGELASAAQAQEYVPLPINIHGLRGIEAASHAYNGGESETRRILTRCGYQIEATPEHPLLVLTRQGTPEWRRADQLGVGDVLALGRGQRMFGSEISVEFTYQPTNRSDTSSKPVYLKELDDDFAYLMGLLTGDGCLTVRNRIILSSADEPIAEFFRSMAARFGLHVFSNGTRHPYDQIIASAQFYQLLSRLGMSAGKAHTKEIPRSILQAPEHLVAAFLRGLFDADGTVEKCDGLVSLSSVSEKLIRQAQVVLLNFGIVSSRSIKQTNFRGRKHRSYLLTIAGAEAARFDEQIGFGLERKRVRRQVRQANTNIDIIAHAGTLLSEAVRTTTFTRAEHNRFYDYRIERRHPGYHKLSELIALLERKGAESHQVRPLQSLLDSHYFFAEITGIDRSRAQVYDLTVPGTHSFTANGFINHNTFLAVAMAVQFLLAKRVNRIVLVRPAVEAGEKLGFLPGDLQDKVDPYLRPLYDSLFDLLDFERVTKFIEKRVIEIAPLAFMRGRTLQDSFIILDEAQNTTSEQMKMFLTRIGFGSKAVITGDVTQIDLPSGRKSGLVEAQRIVNRIDGISFIEFNDTDVVRHRLVQMIIRAYDEHNKKVSL
jgi:phosphate starvation-inducible protein PhoH